MVSVTEAYRSMELHCCSLEEFRYWYKAALSTVSKKQRASLDAKMFCSDGDPRWCDLQHARGLCAHSAFKEQKEDCEPLEEIDRPISDDKRGNWRRCSAGR